MIIVDGVAYTPHNDIDTDNVWLTITEMTNELAKKVIGLPVYIEHDIEAPHVGYVKNAYISNELNLIVKLVLDVDFFNQFLIEQLTPCNRTGKPILRDLSLGHRCIKHINKQTKIGKIVKKIPKEVSLVRKGDRPNCHIFNIDIVPNI